MSTPLDTRKTIKDAAKIIRKQSKQEPPLELPSKPTTKHPTVRQHNRTLVRATLNPTSEMEENRGEKTAQERLDELTQDLVEDSNHHPNYDYNDLNIFVNTIMIEQQPDEPQTCNLSEDSSDPEVSAAVKSITDGQSLKQPQKTVVHMPDLQTPPRGSIKRKQPIEPKPGCSKMPEVSSTTKTEGTQKPSIEKPLKIQQRRQTVIARRPVQQRTAARIKSVIVNPRQSPNLPISTSPLPQEFQAARIKSVIVDPRQSQSPVLSISTSPIPQELQDTAKQTITGKTPMATRTGLEGVQYHNWAQVNTDLRKNQQTRIKAVRQIKEIQQKSSKFLQDLME